MWTRLPAVLALLRRRSVARPSVWIVTLAILAQGWLGAPLALRMAMSEAAAAPATAAAPCHDGDEAAPRGPRHERHGGKRADHDHQRCLICKTSVGSHVVLAQPCIPPQVAVDRPDHGPAPRPPATQALASQYNSRAPPMTA